MGVPNRYDLGLDVKVNGVVSDRASMKFGVREITSELTPAGGRLFKINGRPLLIRGGGWAPDMLLRPNPARQEAELRYVRDMGLNTIRLEGKLEDERFFDLADEYGILVLAGWCCCDRWEQWGQWTDDTRAIAAASQHDQICRLRSHPSVLAWMNGSDNPPPPDVERVYVDILKRLDWPNPYVSSATAKKTTVTGDTGVKMNGPYDWVPPAYWLTDDSRGGAHGFATEISPGAAIPPVESLKRMLPADHLWPIDDVWNYHAGGGQFRTIQTFTDALTARYGAATSLDDYALKAQLMTYEGERAMFEGYARNKFTATGVIQWMLNNAWPSMIWHLYDYYLRPGGGYFGTKKACEPVHVQYSYDDRSIVVVNNTSEQVTGTVLLTVLNLNGAVQLSKPLPIDAAPDSSTRVFTVPEIATLSPVYFLAPPAQRTDRPHDQHELLLAEHEDRRTRLAEIHVVRHAGEKLRRPHVAQGPATSDGHFDRRAPATRDRRRDAGHAHEQQRGDRLLRPAAGHERHGRRRGPARALGGQLREPDAWRTPGAAGDVSARGSRQRPPGGKNHRLERALRAFRGS